MKRLSILTMLFVFVLLLPGAVQAQSPADDQSRPVMNPELLAKAKEDGYVRVVVSLKMEFEPEGKITRDRASDQRARISHAQDDLLGRLASVDADVADVKEFEYIPALAMVVDAKGLEALANDPQVSYVHEDEWMELLLDTSTTLIGADTAWDLGYTGEGWTVAIIDSGVESSHPFFQGRVVSEACYSNTYIPGSPVGYITSACPNGQAQQIGTGAARNCNTSIAGCDHGTHVAGIAAGKSSTLSGVAPGASIIAIQVFTQLNYCYPYTSPCLRTLDSNVLQGLERVYALQNNFKIAAVNLSLGGQQYFSACDADYPEYKAIIDTLRSVGIATIAASGNNGYSNSMSAPACISSAISVGATDKSNQVTDFSNSAYFLDLLAPGKEIYSSVPGYSYDYKDGTSMATPHVTGAWAIRKEFYPEGSVDDILAFFKRTGKPIRDQWSGITTPLIQVGAELPHGTIKVEANVTQAKVGGTIQYTYQAKNTGSIALTLSAYDDKNGVISFSPNPMGPGQTSYGTAKYTVSKSDLPGPLVNKLAITAKPSYGQSIYGSTSASVDLAGFTLSDSVNVSRAKVGETVSYSYQVKNTGNVNLTLSGNGDKVGNLSFSSSTVAPGRTASATANYVVVERDLPGPLVNNATVTGRSSASISIAETTIKSIDVTEVLVATPLPDTQNLSTVNNVVSLALPPNTNASELYYTKLSNPPRLPAVSTGLVFEVTSNQEFNAPLTLTLRYDDNELPANVSEDELTVYSYDTVVSQWLTMTLATTDTNDNTVVFTSDHLGQFALTGHLYTDILYLPMVVK